MNLVQNHKQRTYLDPIHGPIQISLNDPTGNLLANLIDSKEFQRLRRIRQMGLASYTFHGAEHTRFGHSLGTYFIANKMISHLLKYYERITNFKTKILVCALLHDIGHGPFSHTSEKFTCFTHEEWTKKIITGESEINLILRKYDPNFPDKIIKTFEHKATELYISQLISSYIDCDRLDYLHRDSFFVGVPYGLTGSERIIASLEIDDNSKKLIVNEKNGLDVVIHYLHARYSMYKQVYQHKKNLSCDFILRKIIERAKEANLKYLSKPLKDWLNIENKPLNKINLNSFIELDDYHLTSNIQSWAHEENTEKLLSDLSRRFLTRKLFKSLEFREEVANEKRNEILENAKLIAKSKGLDPNYYIGIEQSGSKPYEPYKFTSTEISKAIFIKQKNKGIKELTEVSGLVKALSKENIIKTCLIFTPELEDDLTNSNGFQEFFK